MMKKDDWIRCTDKNPCKVCGHSKWCMVSIDGNVAMCMHQKEGSYYEDKNSQEDTYWLHRLDGAQPVRHNTGGNGKKGHWESTPEALREWYQKNHPNWIFNRWDSYHFADGREQFREMRFDIQGAKPPKTYPVMHPENGGWSTGDPEKPLCVFNLPAIAKGKPVDYVVEGPKCARAMASIGLLATTSGHGALSAKMSDWSWAKGRTLTHIPDKDANGEKYLDDVGAVVTNLNPPAILRVLRLPGLEDGEDVFDWIEARDSMEPEAIKAEIERLAAIAPPWTPKTPAEPKDGPVLVCLDQVKPEKVSWLWPGRVPMGRLTLLVGKPGEGKSFLTTDMAARVTTGSPWPDGSLCPMGSVILISVEDGLGDTIRPRMDAQRADCRKAFHLSMVRGKDEGGKPREMPFTLADVDALRMALEQKPDCRLIVIDPIGSFLGGAIDAHRDNEVRAVLSPVCSLAEKHGPAVLVVAHRRKSAGTAADDLALGSRAFTGIARAVWHVSRDKEGRNRRLLLPGKNNLAPEGNGLAFTISGDPAEIIWEKDPVTMNADDALAIENGEGQRPERMTAAAVWLRDYLKDMQEHSVKSIFDEAKAARLAYRTVQRAADALGVLRHKAGYGKEGWVWRLPKPGSPIDDTGGINDTPGINGMNGEK